MRTIFVLVAAALACVAQNAQEVSATPAVAVFKSSTSLVQVPVVVRDSKGQAVGNLNAGDFQLFDEGKLQTISKFSVEKLDSTAASRTAAQKPVGDAPQAETGTPSIQVVALPDRFVAYLFDDIHMGVADLKFTREAAKKQIHSLDFSHQRVAIVTTSGRQSQEFTSDVDTLDAVLNRITPGMSGKVVHDCPNVNYFMANLIRNQHDADAKSIAIGEAVGCGIPPAAAEKMVDMAVQSAMVSGEQATQRALDTVRALVSRMATLPGQRSLVLISSGFLVLSETQVVLASVIDQALKVNVVIGGLDARGLYTTNPDASEGPMPSPMKIRYRTTEALTLSDSIADLAEGTGGVFFHGSNDYDGGFAKVAAAPEYIYLLAFSPSALKPDGKTHKLKVTLLNSRGFTVQSRKAYFADNRPEDPADQVRRQIQDAFFSNGDSQGMPVRLQAEYFRDGDNATVTANVRVDATKLPFRKDAGRNLDNLTVVIGLFDQNGNFVSAFEKTIEMRLKDETLSAWMKAGIANSTEFTVKPGKYLVRLVVRDSEGELMAQQSTGVEIPW